MFLIIFALITALQVLNIILFLFEVINSEEMILFDSVILSVVAITTSSCMTVLSTRIRVVLTSIGAINSSSTRPQTNRILAMTRVGNAFFSIRVALEVAFTMYCIALMSGGMLASDNGKCRYDDIITYLSISLDT